MRRVNVHVDRLVVDAEADPGRLCAALAEELRARFAAEPAENLRSGHIPAIAVDLPPGAPADGGALGRLAARAIHGGSKR